MPFSDPELQAQYNSKFNYGPDDDLDEETTELESEIPWLPTPIHPLSYDENLEITMDPGVSTNTPSSEDNASNVTIKDTPTTHNDSTDTLLTEGPSFQLVPVDVPAPKEISSAIDTSNIIHHKRRAAVARCDSTEPQSYKQAMSRPDSEDWAAAIKKELQALIDMGVFTEMELPEGAHALGTTCAFRQKTNEDNVVTKYKARLCAQGFSQIPGLDYNKTYAPTGRAASMRLALSVCGTEDLEVRLMDAVGAFLNGIPEEVLYIKIPQGYTPSLTGKNIVLLLNCSLYGLKQSSRCWYNMVKEYFTTINFTPSQSDPCLFISNDPGWRCFVHIHVDDMLVMGKDTQRFSDLIQS